MYTKYTWLCKNSRDMYLICFISYLFISFIFSYLKNILDSEQMNVVKLTCWLLGKYIFPIYHLSCTLK